MLASVKFAYALVLAGMLVGSAHGKAPLRHYLLAPIIAIPVLLVAGIACAIVNGFVFDLSAESVLDLFIGGSLDGCNWLRSQPAPGGVRNRIFRSTTSPRRRRLRVEPDFRARLPIADRHHTGRHSDSHCR